MDFGIIAQLGVAGLAIYFMAEQSKRNEKRIDDRDATSRKFEHEVRTDLVRALEKSTETNAASAKALTANSAVLERIFAVLRKE
jgi:hypothetical protein